MTWTKNMYSFESEACPRCGVLNTVGREPHSEAWCDAYQAGKPGPDAWTGIVKVYFGDDPPPLNIGPRASGCCPVVRRKDKGKASGRGRQG